MELSLISRVGGQCCLGEHSVGTRILISTPTCKGQMQSGFDFPPLKSGKWFLPVFKTILGSVRHSGAHRKSGVWSVRKVFPFLEGQTCTEVKESPLIEFGGVALQWSPESLRLFQFSRQACWVRCLTCFWSVTCPCVTSNYKFQWESL